METEDLKKKLYGLINKWIFDATTGDITSAEERVLLQCAKDLIRITEEQDRAEEIIREMERIL